MKLLSRYLAILVATALCVLISSCDSKNKIELPGYIEGRYTYVSPVFSGILNTLDIQRGATVKKGQLLYTLVSEPEYQDLVSARSLYNETLEGQKQLQSIYDLQQGILTRREQLYKSKYVSTEEMDTAISNQRHALAGLTAYQGKLLIAEAGMHRAEWAAKQKVISSPVDGFVFDTYYTPGEFIGSGKPVLSLLDPSRISIIFYVPQTILGKFKLKKKIDFKCDGCDKLFSAEIFYISPKAEYTPPVIYSNEERNKLVFRIEAKPIGNIAYDSLHPGQPVSVIANIK